MMQLPQVWPQAVQDRTKWDVYAREVAAGLSMKMPWMMTDEEWKAKQAELAKQQQQAMMMQAGMGAVEKAGPELINQAMQGNG